MYSTSKNLCSSTALKPLGPEGEEQEPHASASRSKRKVWGDRAVSIPVNTNTNVFMFIDHYFTYNHISYVADYPEQLFSIGSLVSAHQFHQSRLFLNIVTCVCVCFEKGVHMRVHCFHLFPEPQNDP